MQSTRVITLATLLSSLLMGNGAWAQSTGTSKAATSAPKAPLKVMFAYVGSVGDGGWTYAHERGRLEMQKALGAKVASATVSNVPESQDAENFMRMATTMGYKMVFGTTFGYGDPMLKVAGEHKDVKFEHASGYKTGANMRTYDVRSYESAYMAGIIAGGMSKTGTLGVVASIPIAEVYRNINSFTLGAQSVNPNIKTRVVWVKTWFDQAKEGAAAKTLIDGGADILFQNTDSAAVLRVAQSHGKRAFGWDSDMSAYGPKAHLGSAVINWGPYYTHAVQQALDGTWTGNSGVWWGSKEGAVDLVSIAPDVPANIKMKVDEVKKGLKAGSFSIWKGPLVNSTGEKVLNAGQVADDKFLSGIKFYVAGVSDLSEAKK
ncbi:MAG: BMP family ABC transporter substrate-binding protein [Polaromonas sp.]